MASDQGTRRDDDNDNDSNSNLKYLSATEIEIMEKILSYKIDYKDSDKHLIAQRLRNDNYNAHVCTTEWTAISLKGTRYQATYSFIEIVLPPAGNNQAEEKLIADIHFKAQFEIAKATPVYQFIMRNCVPTVFVCNVEKLRRVIPVLCSYMVDSFKANGFDDIPPWRRSDYMHSKWLSPNRKISPF